MDRSLFLQELTRRHETNWLNDAYPASNNSSAVYLTRDVLTCPPTIVKIILFSAVTVPHPYRVEETGEYIISLDDVEPTAGWMGDRCRSSPDICFMHSFGKCFGKTKKKDASTCHQIHIKRDVLDAIRSTYTFNQRTYFCRTMKANINENVSQKLWNLVGKKLSLQYLEFKTEDIDVTAGSTAYEVDYRKWLLSSGTLFNSKNGQSIHPDNYFSGTNLCPEYAVLGRCLKGASCQNIHGLLVNSLSKHRYVKIALREISKADNFSKLEGQQRQTKALEQQSYLAPPTPQLYPNQPLTLPLEISAFTNSNLPSFSNEHHVHSQFHECIQYQPSASQSLPPMFYVLCKGPVNIFRIVPYST